MEKLLTVFVFVCFTSPLFAQCEFERNEKDDFTGKLTLEAKPVSILSKFMPPNYIDLVLIQEGEDYSIKLVWFGPLGGKAKVVESDYLGLKTKAGVVNTKAVRETEAVLEGQWTLKPVYSATKEDFQTLANSALETIRITLQGENFDYKVKPKPAEKLMIAAGCFFEK